MHYLDAVARSLGVAGPTKSEALASAEKQLEDTTAKAKKATADFIAALHEFENEIGRKDYHD